MVQCPESVIGQEVVDLHVKVVELHIEVQVTVIGQQDDFLVELTRGLDS
jgi:hypothetical protein